MKEFLKECKKVKKMGTEDVASSFLDHQESIIEFYTKKAHRGQDKEAAAAINGLFDIMATEKFVKALNKIRKSKSEDVAIDITFVTVIAGFIEKRHNDENMSDEIVEKYTALIHKLLKKRIKEVNESINIDEGLIEDLLIIVPDKTFIKNDKIVGVYSQKMLRKMYILSQDSDKDLGITDVKTIGKIFKKLIGKKLLDLIAINILLEKREFLKNFNEKQQAIWNLMTQFALKTIEEQDKKHIIELIEYYVARRKRDARNERDSARRISLTSIDAEQYPKLAKAIEKFSKAHADLEKYL